MPKALLARADAAMYRAKRDGRNCVRVWEDYPEWRRSPDRETPGQGEVPQPKEPEDQAGPAPDWRLLAEGMESVGGDQPPALDDSDDWDEV